MHRIEKPGTSFLSGPEKHNCFEKYVKYYKINRTYKKYK